jgi:hypothetical protein
MPITASINRHPETETQSETAAPHPEEMKATFDLAIGNAVSVKSWRNPFWRRHHSSAMERCCTHLGGGCGDLDCRTALATWASALERSALATASQPIFPF